MVLDRDGVLNTRQSFRTGPEAIDALPGAGPALARLRAAGAAVTVLSSQSCVGYGYVTPEAVHETMDRLQQLLRLQLPAAADRPAAAPRLDGLAAGLEAAWGQADLVTFSVGTGSEDSACAPGLADDSDAKPGDVLVRLAREVMCVPSTVGGFMVGDRLSDLATAAAAGLTPVLVLTGAGHDSLARLRAGEGCVRESACVVVPSVVEAADRIVEAMGE